MVLSDDKEAEVFIPERYVKHREILINMEGYGLGIVIPIREMGRAILEGRIAAQIIAARDFVTIIKETAVPKDF